jgi:predicted metal-dependent hydrolase
MNEKVLTILVIIFIYIFLFLHRKDVVYVESYTKEKFMVYKDDMQKDKADMLAKILTNLITLKKYLVENINNMNDYKDYIMQLNKNFNENKTIIYETDPNSELTSYSVNKGEELSFCLKSKKTGDLHDMNIMMYVAIHELAHIGCPEIGHGMLFQKIFKKFAEEAINIGIYTKDDYSVNNVEYCGMIVTSSIL